MLDFIQIGGEGDNAELRFNEAYADREAAGFQVQILFNRMTLLHGHQWPVQSFCAEFTAFALGAVICINHLSPLVPDIGHGVFESDHPSYDARMQFVFEGWRVFAEEKLGIMDFNIMNIHFINLHTLVLAILRKNVEPLTRSPVGGMPHNLADVKPLIRLPEGGLIPQLTEWHPRLEPRLFSIPPSVG
jgi:hypothetical protein